MSDYNIIFGGGKFGSHFIKTMDYPILSFIIDNDSNCLLANKFPKMKIEEAQKRILQNRIIFKSELKQNMFFFIEGTIETVYELMKIRNPNYIVPTAPIHVIFELIKVFIHKNFPNINLTAVKPRSIFKKPDELFVFSFDNPEIYFSYADWEEKCPENCPSPLDYCPFHKRKKPITVSDFLEHELSENNYFGFESTQIGPGYGGIEGKLIKNRLDKLFTFIDGNSNNCPIEILVGTTCNCHGVLSGLQLLDSE
ncbi:hypothetical protein DSAG12_02502 [Promethearchaeum syntrophicum]|uniref:Uncharacterized protein n=1 Tax=Promethearchaeum syntrophicum TaxID=2594042 RepID=A0A5B9DC30_9ARCH|nr:hypothetical protein [Candidatus Prometheoarchaeum syntrophicum]QEE16672.1 hypothetical protein DSAG12_02502 [Candidatus Prometheoarchaeum syntrophicum]